MTQPELTFPLKQFGGRVLRLNRRARIGIVLAFAVFTALVLDRLFTPTFTGDSASGTFAISVFFGVIMYVIGWWQLVGFTGDVPPPSRTLSLYLAFGLLLTVAAVGLLLVSLAALALPS
ncbi:MAG: hypothetical protein SF162_14675 [bacterium]|nr:hypothetical protein [bacterium]